MGCWKMNLDNDFFGYNLNTSDTPVDFSDVFSDLYEDRSTGVSEQPNRKDLSSDGGYIPINSSTEFYPDPTKDFKPPTVEIKTVRHQFRHSKLNKLFWKCGASLVVVAGLLFFAHLAIAERTGNLDDTREHHLSLAGDTLPALSLLSLVGVFAGIGKVEELIGVFTDEKSNQ